MAYEESTGIGLRYTHVGLRDDDGTMAIQGTVATGTAYSGIRASRARALTVTPAEPQRVNARGDDVTYYTFLLPPTDSPTGELRTQQSDTALIALITGVRDFGSGNMSMTPLSTDNLGTEDPCMVWGSRIAIQSAYGLSQVRVWETYFILNAAVVAQPQGFEIEQIGEFVWNITANSSSTDQFGRALAVGTHGCLEAAYMLIKTRYRFAYDVFEGDGAETAFTLSQGANTVHDDANSPVMAFVDGVQQTPSGVSSAGVVTLAAPPADGAKVAIQYEWTL